MAKKFLLPVIVKKNADGSAVMKMVNVSEDTAKFFEWVSSLKNPNTFEYREKQVGFVEQFFRFSTGDGKTTLLKLLLKFDEKENGSWHTT